MKLGISSDLKISMSRKVESSIILLIALRRLHVEATVLATKVILGKNHGKTKMNEHVMTSQGCAKGEER
jgi:hypothetical protein